jgi:hypothetical protein
MRYWQYLGCRSRLRGALGGQYRRVRPITRFTPTAQNRFKLFRSATGFWSRQECLFPFWTRVNENTQARIRGEHRPPIRTKRPCQSHAKGCHGHSKNSLGTPFSLLKQSSGHRWMRVAPAAARMFSGFQRMKVISDGGFWPDVVAPRSQPDVHRIRIFEMKD